MLNQIINADARAGLKQLGEESVQCVMEYFKIVIDILINLFYIFDVNSKSVSFLIGCYQPQFITVQSLTGLLFTRCEAGLFFLR